MIFRADGDPDEQDRGGAAGVTALLAPPVSNGLAAAARNSPAPESPAGTVLRLDQPNVRNAVTADPDAIVQGLPEPVVIDEWQEAPDVLGAIKRSVDGDPRPGRYILTGSVRAELENQS